MQRKRLPDLLDLRRLGIVQARLRGSPQRVPPVNIFIVRSLYVYVRDSPKSDYRHIKGGYVWSYWLNTPRHSISLLSGVLEVSDA